MLTVFRSAKVPVQHDMLRTFLNGLAERNGGKIDYNMLMLMINWRANPVTQLKQETNWSDESWFGNQPAGLVKNVNVLALIQDLLGVERH